MHRMAKEIYNPVALAQACMGIGMGYARKGNHQEAVHYLERAKDYTFETSRQLSGLVLSFLARAYAKIAIHMRKIQEKGYGDVKAVRDFREYVNIP
jgi:hypothetical protein